MISVTVSESVLCSVHLGTVYSIITAHSEPRKVLFLAPSVLCVFCLCMKYLGHRWTDFRQIHTEDEFGPSLGWVWRSKVKGQGHQRQKHHFRPFRRPVCGLCLV